MAIAAVWLLRWVRLSAIARAARALPLDLPIPVRATPALMEPGLVGIWRPVILLPEGLSQQLSRREIDAILNHELCHYRRRDNLLAAAHMLVEALFWFHPLVWFIGARLIEEREAACDESVLAGGQNPLEYAEAILRVCRIYLRSPLSCASGVAGADLGRRVDAIMARRDLEDIDPARKLLLAGLLLATILVPLAAGGLRFAPPAQLVQRLATALLSPAVTVQPATITMRATAVKRPRIAVRPADPIRPVKARMIQEPAIPAAPSLVFVTAPQLPDESQPEEAKVCRAPQQLQDSRLLGPEVCLSQGEWDQIKGRGLVLMPDGQTLAADYDKERARRAGSCYPRSLTSGSMNVTNGTICF
ncbi:MAG: M48 family metalloprotease [Alphaproteobacteria bacterium]|nr:M48 family metalloprotease [Alphaproteobacteria bacterium]